MKLPITSLLVALAVIFQGGCDGGGDGSTPLPCEDPDAEISATIDGQAWVNCEPRASLSNSNELRVESNETTPSYDAEDALIRNLQFSMIRDFDGTFSVYEGNYNVPEDIIDFEYWTLSETDEQDYFEATGEITIDSASEDRVKGTFEFQVQNGSIPITGGVFSVPLTIFD